MNKQIRILLKLNLIYAFNVRIIKSKAEIYDYLNGFVDFNDKPNFFTMKMYTGQKYSNQFLIERKMSRSKGIFGTITGTFLNLRNSTILKVRISLNPLEIIVLSFLNIVLFSFAMFIIGASIYLKQILILVFLIFIGIIILVLYFSSISLYFVRNQEFEKKIRKFLSN